MCKNLNQLCKEISFWRIYSKKFFIDSVNKICVVNLISEKEKTVIFCLIIYFLKTTKKAFLVNNSNFFKNRSSLLNISGAFLLLNVIQRIFWKINFLAYHIYENVICTCHILQVQNIT